MASRDNCFSSDDLKKLQLQVKWKEERKMMKIRCPEFSSSRVAPLALFVLLLTVVSTKATFSLERGRPLLFDSCCPLPKFYYIGPASVPSQALFNVFVMVHRFHVIRQLSSWFLRTVGSTFEKLPNRNVDGID